ncbi:MerR family transcriptional regulator [Marinomonas rhizomae]|uniref:MerR family transcriptional regulator n=1 Tax=Marinomonas rhizomae TaxID=491948 RepID=A0A366JII8_9GAMM|nr:helix-turn-helix domain-containing protein [Marinomonas rhizomae]RBP85628.1 MerR family transcriptional regulator [Marinomonas rhizomae]RNF75744.1 MerR family transcriptional regulator [Marinomonas rhizomae]
MDIAEVAKRSGVSASTLRFYEEKGLIRSVGRRGLRRVFDANILEQLALIALGRASGFSLDEIAGMLGSKGQPNIDRELLISKSEELDKTIQKLTAMRDGLRHAAVCSAPSHMECPTFRRLLGLAASSAINGEGVKKISKKQRLIDYKITQGK